MALHFLLEGPLSASAGDEVALTGAEAHHAAKVRRVRVGEAVTVGDGHGAWLTGVVESVSPSEVIVRIESRDDVAPVRPRLVLVQALAKTDRDELAIQAATELGVDEIVPWQAARSVSRWDAAKATKGRARWNTIVREAAKQAHRAWLPTVAELSSTADLLARARTSRVVVLEPQGTEALSELQWNADESDILLVVGPEGGIAAEELEALADAGARLARLGETVLRTSTAGPAAIAVMNVALRRW
ncbi:16S rRNA (uracil(1498)-N(3))-methyltransferase [Microbacterium sp. C7(2022)]|uniref:16S rRNA (uracil(1498)-N(3))-methyltransferase n=1 Tax=Microbacterium sp. C7(2022) TaxID=2992759 RepID=UPI00237A29ED|nr:16S rRNA (uracil(1498)-N(3))-methyltransferase [Microbacterium sp. C7(2022)]MDE0547019.1 16S rRNA (uracil(1498)-N(3))-methyltransferase [Microbacterium sp. C7(2022)]